MVSAKGKPTDPKLKEKITEEVKQQTNKDGSGKGQMAAWKAAKIGKEYEAQGGDYENEPGSKDKPEKGPPQKKSEEEKKAETDKDKTNGKDKKANTDKEKANGKDKKADTDKGNTNGDDKKEKKKSNAGRPKLSEQPRKWNKEMRQGERKSGRQAGKSAEHPPLESSVQKPRGASKKRDAEDTKESEKKKAKTDE